MNTWKDWRSFNLPANKMIHPSGDNDTQYDAQGLSAANDLLDAYPDMQFKKTLDYGCGNGRILRHLKKYPVYGVDIVPAFIAEAQRYTDRAYMLDDMYATDFEIAFSITVFIHLDDEQTKEALHYIRARLVPRGVAYLQIPIYNNHTLPRNILDVRTWSAPKILDLFDEVGFEVEELYINPGHFSYTAIGENHNKLHKLIKL